MSKKLTKKIKKRLMTPESYEQPEIIEAQPEQEQHQLIQIPTPTEPTQQSFLDYIYSFFY